MGDGRTTFNLPDMRGMLSKSAAGVPPSSLVEMQHVIVSRADDRIMACQAGTFAWRFPGLIPASRDPRL